MPNSGANGQNQHQPGVYVPLRALFLVANAKTKALILSFKRLAFFCVLMKRHILSCFSIDIDGILVKDVHVHVAYYIHSCLG